MEQVLHSLLQKAVRRGNTEMVNNVLQYFIQNDKHKWLRDRLAVITAEECWPYFIKASFERTESGLIHHYNQLTTAVKNKDAAGLGSLALAYKEKSYFVPADTAITEVAELLTQPNTFWEGTKSGRFAPATHIVVAKAEEAYRKCKFAGDKSTAIAAVYLAIKQGVPEVEYSVTLKQPAPEDFPIWIAFDRHTSLGAKAIYTAANEIGADINVAPWLAFYIEGSKCGELASSYWWNLFLQCRYYLHKISPEEAQEIWSKLVPVIQGLLIDKVEQVKEVLGRYSPVEDVQLSLF